MCNSDNNGQTTNTSLSSVDNELRNIVTAECFDTNIEDRLCVPTNEIDLNEIPINALQSKSRNILSNLLNPQKMLLENGFFRDWRGVLQCALPKYNVLDISSKQDQMKEVLIIWYKEDKENATLGQLQSILQRIDRWDALQDTNNFAEDCNEYWRMKLLNRSNPSKIYTSEKYDALVLFAVKDSDFGDRIITELERTPCSIPDPWDSYRILAFHKHSSLIYFWQKLFQSVAKHSNDLLPETNETAKMRMVTPLEPAKSFASAKPKPETIENVLTKQENETVSSTDRLLSNLPEIVSDEPCSSTISEVSDKKKKKWFPKFRKLSKYRTAVKDITNE